MNGLNATYSRDLVITDMRMPVQSAGASGESGDANFHPGDHADYCQPANHYG
ncbi:hypothetical protein FHS16_003931 [Paenibacillus endophyticus]|uniref:Uncharacterized protein n=1 Tax=Paenibacillus endophyticus TaxID=1294268 RepID=A0A7W5C9X7_9BACL|nr:hypothetical protein [Paenibacillus endophyticus]